MTILGAMNCGEYLVLASDSLAYDPIAGIKYHDEKIWQVPGMNVVWGFAGGRGIGGDLHRWIDGVDKSALTTWDVLRGNVVRVLSTMNGTRREMAALAKTGEPQDLSAAVFAGYIGGEPEILSVDDNGNSTLMLADGQLWDGGPYARTAAEAAFRTLMAERGRDFVRDESLMKRIMEIVTSTAMGVEPPVQMFRIDASGATKVL